MRLRAYQQTAVDAALHSMQSGRNPVISLPTGSGKSLVAAAICATRPGRALVLSHRKELLVQDQEALTRFAPEISSGIYSAGLNQRDTAGRIIFGGVASVYRRLDELQACGKFDTILIDEAHLVAPSNGDGKLYKGCIEGVGNVPLCGLTATPYRLDSGQLHCGDGAWFDDLCVHIKPSELIPEYLSPLIGVGSNNFISTDGVRRLRGEFDAGELSQVACADGKVEKTITELLNLAVGRRHVIIFGIDIEHCQMITEELARRGERSELIIGVTPANDRARILNEFKAGDIRFLVNCAVLTTGFDAPIVDGIAMLRPTMSKGLYVQMIGRGMRKADEKEDCAIWDFAGNVQRHGSLDFLSTYIPSERERREKTGRGRIAQDTEKSRQQQKEYTHQIFSQGGDLFAAHGNGESSLIEKRVVSVRYFLEDSRKNPGKTNLVVQYTLDDRTSVRQWVCFQYSGGARWHAMQWFRRHGVAGPIIPTDPDLVMRLVRSAPRPSSLSVYQEGPWWRVGIEHYDTEQKAGAEVAEECA